MSINNKDIIQQESNLLRDVRSYDTITNIIYQEFSKTIHLNRFQMSIDRILRNSDIIKFNVNKWIHRPDLFCKDYYDFDKLKHIILLVNNISSYYNFTPENCYNQYIIAPKEKVINDIVTEILNSKRIK